MPAVLAVAPRDPLRLSLCPFIPQLKHTLDLLSVSAVALLGGAGADVVTGRVPMDVVVAADRGFLLASPIVDLSDTSSLPFTSSKQAFKTSSSKPPSIPINFLFSSGHSPATNWFSRKVCPIRSA